MVATLKQFYSLEEYRTIEAQALERSEYRHGEIIPRPGGSLNHSRIGRNILMSQPVFRIPAAMPLMVSNAPRRSSPLL